ncbi:MAG: helix-turn-helix domain-containing protein [Christensenellales bacterium]|jgi:transcriptional regulator with XRE-family HTH domain
MLKFPDILRDLRISNNLTQQELASKLKISKSTVSMYENGKREPDIETFEIIADFFNVDINYLTGNVPVMPTYDIKKRRIELDLSIEDMGKAVGVSKSTIQRWETGDFASMKRDQIPLLANVLEITAEELTGWTARPRTKDELEMLNIYLRAKKSDKVAVKALVKAIDKLLKIDEQGDAD